jgi:hypothetical protein
MHDEPKASKVVVQFNNCVVKILSGLEAVKIRHFSFSILAEKPAFTGVQVSIFVFGELGELKRWGRNLKSL